MPKRTPHCARSSRRYQAKSCVATDTLPKGALPHFPFFRVAFAARAGRPTARNVPVGAPIHVHPCVQWDGWAAGVSHDLVVFPMWTGRRTNHVQTSLVRFLVGSGRPEHVALQGTGASQARGTEETTCRGRGASKGKTSAVSHLPFRFSYLALVLSPFRTIVVWPPTNAVG